MLMSLEVKKGWLHKYINNRKKLEKTSKIWYYIFIKNNRGELNVRKNK